MAILTIAASSIQLGDEILFGEDEAGGGATVVVVWPFDQLDDSHRFTPESRFQVRQTPWPDFTLSFPMDQLVTVSR